MASKIKEWLSAESVSQTLKAAFDDKIQDIDLTGKVAKNSLNIIVIFLLTILYVANGYSMEKLQREHNRLESQVNELRLRAVATNAELMILQKASNISQSVQNTGLELKPSNVATYKLKR